MSRVRFYAATSVDGFIAGRDGGIDWLAPFDARTYGYDEFVSEIGAIILGRRTFEMIQALGDWPYAGKRAWVVSSRSHDAMPKGVIPTRRGVDGAVGAAREARVAGDIWIMGGATTMQTAVDLGLVDMIDLFIVPVVLGSGVPLLGDLERHRPLVLDELRSFQDGVVKLRYRLR